MSARFSYTLSALDGHYLLCFLDAEVFGGNVHPYHTACARTGGHWDIGNVWRLILQKSLWVGGGRERGVVFGGSGGFDFVLVVLFEVGLLGGEGFFGFSQSGVDGFVWQEVEEPEG